MIDTQTDRGLDPSLPRVSVIVPHYDDLPSLDRALDSLAGQGAAEIIVCDNQSPAGLRAVAATIAGRALLVSENERGAGAARNRGRQSATGALLAFIDADCVADPSWLSAGTSALETADVVGGDVLVFSSRASRRSGADVFETIFGFRQKHYIEAKGFSVTANLFVRSSVFDAVGGFMVGPSEDLEWCQRATSRGFKISFAPAAVVRHPTRPDWPALRKKWQRLTVESLALHKLRGKSRLRWIARAFAVAASALPHSGQVVTARQFTPLERAAGIVTLWRIRIWRAAVSLRLSIDW